MLGVYFPGQSYPGQSGGFTFGIVITPDAVHVVTTIDEATFTQNYNLIVQDILQAHDIDPAIVLRPIRPQDLLINTGIDNVTILVLLKPKPQPPTVTIDRPSADREIVTITGDVNKYPVDIAGAYDEKPRVSMDDNSPQVVSAEP